MKIQWFSSTGSPDATATKRSYLAPTVFDPKNSGIRYDCRITWHFVWFYWWWSKPDFWWWKSTSFNLGLFSNLGFRIKSEKWISPWFYFWKTKNSVSACYSCWSCPYSMIYTRNFFTQILENPDFFTKL